jgi:YVTN family beta-propeller protein
VEPRKWLVCALIAAGTSALGAECGFHEPKGHALFASPQSNPLALSRKGDRLYVANTTSGSVSVVDTRSRRVLEEIAVGIAPVGIALRPDGSQLWVANHVSDSVSVVDTDRRSPTYHQVVATVQDLDAAGVTRFDEPVAIAFASDSKAYVSLSSRNEIAVVEIGEGGYRVRPQRIRITAQEPRALAVRDGRLYVAAFESSNQTEMSSCARGDDPPQCTFGPLGFEEPFQGFNIVVDPDAPDRDLFVFDTRDESLVDVVSHVGTLLYGVAVGGGGRVFVTHTDARNAVNGLDGGDLADLDNRIYLNRVAAIDCGGDACRFEPTRDLFDLEPLPPQPVPAGRQLATPYGVAVSGDDSVLVATAAASSRVFSLDARDGSLLDVLDVGPTPRGIALESHLRTGRPRRAYVLETLGNAVTVVDVSHPERLRALATIPVGRDPTPEAVRLGRIAFNDAGASSSGTFACASCHPDAHTDQLLWRIGAACSPVLSDICGLHEARTTQPVRGLRNTLPLHWDGTLGDPFGGPNGSVGVGNDGGVDCALDDADGDHDCFLDLVQESLSGVMCDQAGPCPRGGNRLSEAERDHMATFLASVWHPPARSRAVDDGTSASALDGFADFFVDQGGLDRGTCADSTSRCHVLPLLSSTNGTNRGLRSRDAPSLRGLTDRHVMLAEGANSSEEMLLFMNDPQGLEPPFAGARPSEFPYDPALGADERSTFAVGFLAFRPALNVGPVDIFQMLEEVSTGTSGATGRQVTLGAATLSGGAEAATLALLEELEAADARGVVSLEGELAREPRRRAPDAVSYLARRLVYLVGVEETPRDELLAAARAGEITLTLTAQLPSRFAEGVHRQPLIAPLPGAGETGDPDLPVLPGDNPVTLEGIDVRPGALLLVDGQPTSGAVECVDGAFEPEFCSSQRVSIRLDAPPAAPGLHLLQIQNPQGPLSNELPLCVGGSAACR